MKPKIFVTRKIYTEVLLELKKNCEVEIWDQEDVPVPRHILEEKIPHIDGLYCLLTENIDKKLLDEAKNLKIISNMAVGYNNIDISAATEKGILVTNTPGVLTETTADLTFALLMATARRIIEADRYLKEGHWKTWSPNLLTGQEIHGSNLGIIGLGEIGIAVAKRAKGFNMNILYYNRNRKHEVESSLGIHYADLNSLLKQSDFVCVLTPYTPETKNLIDKEQLRMMKKSAILINTARGGIVNENALYDALTSEVIWGAGLDVFEEEPVSLKNSLLALPNVVVLPHIGSASLNTRMEMARMAACNILQALNGEVPQNLINKELACT
ncbi:2-hydroxyacid dehydrogenase [Priestia megaterium]|uniref:2-hydroxyacid dehydrogenase n=1 Tax=Priestia megaterium TaxID=1404 RepID=UPI000D5076D2|nr:D-glycerate dehydrogenase [Priestia megaterium]PVE64480.1 D-glycerate dehydrogenase [Priestia megaterium]PVE79854.1 D-glycerate dehydrogenase [Priestia megaterium]PVE83761.1 D-glycerate dehydrogenase [Priestia megaterium]PVE99561.1 D-glycerate dehydrogenase [Priestia megaterium]